MDGVVQPAGFWIRLGANLLDLLIIGLPLSIIGFVISGSIEEGHWSTNLVSTLYYLLVPIFWMGYTVGKRICGVRIVKVNGNKLGFGTMLLRAIVAGLIYGITLGIGLIVSAFMVALRDDKRSIHDMIAGTYVTHAKPGAEKSVEL
ncbi:RDD family protein [Metabacillus iocasae]|uniref:RDD family membrane protein YckC n=1 Tax=Priestia iocasae TaxID=2291674 RepID=A0ABS2QVB0_9BACI|nr:RDD family protein [Metabacillus iocasae]MBM7703436.1 putative RDD family membrane protein YckC [Metabacillus iocasae]